MKNGTLIFTELPNGNLMIKATKEGRELIKDCFKALGTSKSYDDIWYDLLELTSCNGSYTLVKPEDIAALTTAPIISDDIDIEDDGSVNVRGKVWWFPEYMVRDELRELMTGKKIEFTKAD